VFTNKTWTDAYRGAGRPEATFAIERIMDELAVELGRDPLELREQNWISHDEFPYTNAAGLIYDSGNYEAATARAKALFDYDPMEPVLDMEAALAEGATLVHPDHGSNKWAFFPLDSATAGTGGDADKAIAAAEADPDSIVVKRRFRQQRLIPAFMEPRSIVVDPTGEQLTMWSATQVPHIVKTMTALSLGLPEHKVRVIAPDVGGGFGGKLQVIPEEFLSVLVARRMGKPVKWTETRSESMMSGHHGRAQI